MKAIILKNYTSAVSLMDRGLKKKVLVLVEGEKADVAVMEKLFELYPEINTKYQIVSYCTSIYVLYQEFFSSQDSQDELDLLQVLKSREPDLTTKRLFDDKYTDILLIFDLDPQDPMFSEQKIRRMQDYFRESSDMGKLYLNFPMVEAFFHMPNIPDIEFLNRVVGLDELIEKKYKQRVGKESRGHDYRKFIRDRKDANYVILENIRKAQMIISGNADVQHEWREINFPELLERQLCFLRDKTLYVLCTCVMYVYDYNYELLFQD